MYFSECSGLTSVWLLFDSIGADIDLCADKFLQEVSGQYKGDDYTMFNCEKCEST